VRKKHQLFLDGIAPIWHKDTLFFERQLEEYSNEARLSAVAAAIEFLKTPQKSNSQNNHGGSDSDKLCLLRTLQMPRLSPTIF
jgi:hypothetical protein